MVIAKQHPQGKYLQNNKAYKSKIAAKKKKNVTHWLGVGYIGIRYG
jgi:hypothetical protein